MAVVDNQMPIEQFTALVIADRSTCAAWVQEDPICRGR